MRIAGQSVCLLPTQMAVHDIADAEGFVAATIVRSRIKPSPSEHEELLAEGIAILYELAEKFEPQREGYERPGRFSGFAAQFLPRKLGDAWHKAHPEHRYVTGPDGKRRWVFFASPSSINDVLEEESSDRDRRGPRAQEFKIRTLNKWSEPVT